MHKVSESVGEWLSPRQLQEWLGLGRTTVYALLDNEIPNWIWPVDKALACP